MGLTKAQLEALNDSSFPNNNAGAITPTILRNYNDEVILNTVNQDVYSTDSASFDNRLDNINFDSSSLVTTASFNAYTQSTNLFTASISTSVGLLQTFSGSQYKTDSSSFDSRINNVVQPTNLVTTASFNAYTASQDFKNTTFATTGSNTFIGNQIITGSLGVSSSITANVGIRLPNDTAGQTIVDQRTRGVRIYNTDTFSETYLQLGQNSPAGGVVLSQQSGKLLVNVSASFTGDVSASGGISSSTINGLGNATLFSASVNSRINSITVDTSSLVTTSSFNAYTSSNDTKVNNLTAQTASYAISSSVKTVTDGLQTQINGLSTTASVNTLSASIFQTDATQSNNINSLTALTASIAYTNVNNTFGGTQTFNNIAVNGTASIAYLQTVTGSAKIIGDAFIILNNDTPTERYAGIIVVDSGSVNTTGSFQFDGLTNDWFYEYTGSDALNYGVTLFGPEYGTKGSPIYNTANTIVKGGGGHHIIDSNITDNGSIVTINSNTNITGSLTASGLKYPSVDNGEKSFIQTDGAGNLSLQYVDTIFEAFYAGESVPKGTPLYFSGSQGANPIARAADASNPAKMPVVVVANVNLTAGTTYEGIVLGLIEGIDLTGYTAGQTVYVAEGGGWSTSLPSGSNSITQVLGVVTKGGNGGKGLVLNPGPAQLPGLIEGYVWVGNGSNQPTAVATSSFIDVFQTGSFATTGSNTFNGNQVINGSLQVSSSATYDLDITGGFQATAASRISGSNGIASISQVSVQVTSGSGANLISSIMARGYVAATSASNQIALYGGISSIGGFGSGKVGGGIAVSSGSAGSYYFPIEFQASTAYTDGRVTISTPLSASAGITSSDAFINGELYSVTSASFNSRIIAAENTGFVTTASFNAYTQSTNDFTASITASFNTLSGSYVATSQSFNDLSSSFLIVSSSTLRFATTGSNNFIGNQSITGSLILSSSAAVELQVIGALEITGGVAGNVTALSVASNTASIDFNLGSVFTLTIPSSAITYITGSNLKPGQTANIILTQQVTTGSVRFESTLFKFPSGSINTGSALASAVDMVSVASVSSTTLYSVAANRLI